MYNVYMLYTYIMMNTLYSVGNTVYYVLLWPVYFRWAEGVEVSLLVVWI